MDDRTGQYDGGAYAAAKNWAKAFYRTIGKIWSPALNDYVYFTAEGFWHLIFKGKRLRAKSDQGQRFIFLKHVPIILADRTAKPLAELKGSSHYWIFEALHEGFKVKTIVRQGKNGRKYFVSVYGKKQKSVP